MQVLCRLLQAIDHVSEHMGRLVSWLTVVMIVVVAYNVFLRYVLNLSLIHI